MSQKTIRIVFTIAVAILLFSIWAAFALLIVNRLFYQDLPGYTIGRICIWEGVAFIVALLISVYLTRKWGAVELETKNGIKKITVPYKFGIFFLCHLLFAIIIAIWQFFLFSQQF